jgi:uncharacterized protein YpmS
LLYGQLYRSFLSYPHSDSYSEATFFSQKTVAHYDFDSLLVQSTRICWALEPNLVTSGKFRLEIINFSVGFPVLVEL